MSGAAVVNLVDPTTSESLNQSRFWSIVLPPTEQDCRLWAGKTHKDKYGLFEMLVPSTELVGINIAFEVRAHRYALFGENCRVEPLLALHTRECTSKLCCNPNHLYAGTNKDNNDDEVALGRQGPQLTEDQILDIFVRNRNGQSGCSIATVHGINQNKVYDVLHGRKYKNIHPEIPRIGTR